jgi:hypothetical protein
VPLSAAFALGGITMVHGLAQSAQRSIGRLAVTATSPIDWIVFGATIALTCVIEYRLVRDPLSRPALSVAPVTVSEH